jgi:hypothetical protein
MDNLKGNIAPRNDLPGSLDFVFRYIDANFEGAGTISTMPYPPPIQSPSEKHHVKCSLAPNSPAWTTKNDKLNTTINGNDATALLSSG